MRKGLLGGVAAMALLLASGTVASAADMSAPATVDWSGLYAGVHGGYGEVYTSGLVDPGSFQLEQSDLNLNGAILGAQVGYNVQMDSIVFGIEADASYLGLGFNDKNWDTPSTGESNTAADIDLLASVRGRLGVAMDNTLLYVTGGLAMTDAESSFLNSGTLTKANYGGIGGVVGGGVEFKSSETMSWRAEGLYYIFDDDESMADAHSGVAGDKYTLDDAFAVRLGVNFFLN